MNKRTTYKKKTKSKISVIKTEGNDVSNENPKLDYFTSPQSKFQKNASYLKTLTQSQKGHYNEEKNDLKKSSLMKNTEVF